MSSGTYTEPLNYATNFNVPLLIHIVVCSSGLNNEIMIIVNLYCEKDYDPTTDGFHLHLAGVVNDELNLYSDPQLITECIENDPDFEPKAGKFYEIQLIRGTIASDPIPEPAFAIDRVIEKKHDVDFGWVTPLVRM